MPLREPPLVLPHSLLVPLPQVRPPLVSLPVEQWQHLKSLRQCPPLLKDMHKNVS
jgi:hypothetical protein